MKFPVSIIIPTYIKKIEEIPWLSECVQSAFENECEVVLWDDGTTVVDVESIAYVMGVNKFGKFFENVGVSAARNAAVKLATQPFIFPLDCDDILQPGSIEKMLSVWEGKPIYPDVEKFGDVTVPHFKLLDFSCNELLKSVGPYPASVLHLKEQWTSIGGWNEKIAFYEDGEYNARLMFEYCGQRYPEPLLRYRFHPAQRTRKYNAQASKYNQQILTLVQRSFDMAKGCCGGKRKTDFSQTFQQRRSGNPDHSIISSDTSVQVQFAAGELAIPLEADGKILARYVGGYGKGKHVYKGNVTNFAHMRIKYGDLVYANPQDVKDPASGYNGGSSLIKVVVQSEVIKLEPKIVEPIKRQPVRQTVERVPVEDDPNGNEDEDPGGEEEDVEIGELTLKQIKKEITSGEEAEFWLPIEAAGKNRKGVIDYLESLLA